MTLLALAYILEVEQMGLVDGSDWDVRQKEEWKLLVWAAGAQWPSLTCGGLLEDEWIWREVKSRVLSWQI